MPRADLTPMQVDLLRQLVSGSGLSLAQIGARMGFSVDQIDREMSNLRRLTGLRSRGQLIEWWKAENRRIK